MDDRAVSIVVVGLGGYGDVYLADLLDGSCAARCRIVGAVDPEPHRCSHLSRLRELRVPIFRSLEEFYADGVADLAVLSSPIQLHCEQTCQALTHGSNVLCEKPAAATVQDVERMATASKEADRFVAIGFQWSFSPGIQSLKRDIQQGLLGEPRLLRSLTLWPRDESYYKRNDWAGRLRDDAGRWVLDNPANNAMAHDLHNMLYLLGEQMDRSAQPTELVAETYRANEIETFDTVVARVRTAGGAVIMFVASHAVNDVGDPRFRGEFENATLDYPGGDAKIIARFHGGEVKRYASPVADAQTRKLWMCVDNILAAGELPCGLEAARSHTVCVNGIHESMPRAKHFSRELIRCEGESGARLTYVTGLAGNLHECYQSGALPSELHYPWAARGETVSLRGYDAFPRRSL